MLCLGNFSESMLVLSRMILSFIIQIKTVLKVKGAPLLSTLKNQALTRTTPTPTNLHSYRNIYKENRNTSYSFSYSLS